ncbi:MAG TPA: valine--tRNA ligase [Pirellulales bacterium]|nr:valine--tRNA ligase [Pirellulales bacterium]
MTTPTSAAEELPKQYDHAAAQERWYQFWESRGYFNSDPPSAHKAGDGIAGAGRQPFTIVIPPPNVTGALHLGHALNNTLQDIIIRFKRMQGYNTLWMPGTDHAGIATQAVVERRLFEEEKKTRHDLGSTVDEARKNLLQRIWEWKEKYGARILEQFKQMGFSCDWRRTRFTLDEMCARAVRHTFFQMFKDGLIFRGKRLVNWDTHLQTAVADDEVYHETVKGHFWHIRYPVIPLAGKAASDEPQFVTIATTRPETMLGDTAVAVHPDPAAALDKVERELREKLAAASAKEKTDIQKQLDDLANRRQTVLPTLLKLRDMALAGRKLRLPLAEREIPLIADMWAKPELGSGCVKITPAHDENDYQVWQRHKEIGAINIMNPDGLLNDAVPEKYRGLKMHTKAREAVVADLIEQKLHNPETDRENREIDLAHSDRSKTPIEPYLADQWFVAMDKDFTAKDGSKKRLAQWVMGVVTDGKIKITPPRYAKSYLDWLGEKRDWCISRSLWWGHRVPVWTKEVYTKSQETSYVHTIINHSLYKAGEIDYSVDLPIGVKGRRYGTPVLARIYVCLRDENPEVIQRLEEAGYEPSDRPLFNKQRDDASLYTEIQDEYTTQFYRQLLKQEFAEDELEVKVEIHERLTPTDQINKPYATISVRILSKDQSEIKNKLKTFAIDQYQPKEIELEPEVLDTWFSSALWPMSTLGWPGPALADQPKGPANPEWSEQKYYYPTSVLITSREIITLWVARMVLMGLYNLGEIPFHDVYIHPKILDGYGETMSKSKGNGVDPLDIISKFGTDALRFGLAYMATETQDVRMPVEFECPHCKKLIEQTQKNRTQPRVSCPHCGQSFSTQWAAKPEDTALPRAAVVSERFELARNFCNKLWNAARFALLNLEGYKAATGGRAGSTQETAATNGDESLSVEDRWILSRLNTVTAQVTAALDQYKFADAARLLYDFAWDEFCSFYLEMSKSRLQDEKTRPLAQRILAHTLDVILRLLHPMAPFITEDIWQRLNAAAPERGFSNTPHPNPLPQVAREKSTESVMIAPWPGADLSLVDEEIEARFARFQEVLAGLREVRARHPSIGPKTTIQFSARCDAATAKLLEPMRAYFESMAGGVLTAIGPGVAQPPLSSNFTAKGAEVYVDMAQHIDVTAEISRNEKELAKFSQLIAAKEKQLANEAFVSRAPAAVIAKERAALEELKAAKASIEATLALLQAKKK